MKTPAAQTTERFQAKIQIIGVNPYVLIPATVLKAVFAQAGKDKGAIPIKGMIDGHPYIQTLVRYSGKWRLYLNTPMRKAAGKDVGDTVDITICYDPADRTVPMHPKLEKAFKVNKEARAVFEKLSPSRKKEILRYLHFSKNEETTVRNVAKAINFLCGKERFIGRDNP